MTKNLINELITIIQNNELVKINFTNFREKNLELEKVIATPILIKEKNNLQFEYRFKRIIKHNNIPFNSFTNLNNEIEKLILLAKDINIKTTNENINVKISKKFKILIKRTKEKNFLEISYQNKRKNYILNDEICYPFLMELGIQSTNGKIKNDKYNKFKQINKYLEFIYNSIKELDKNKTIKILDFGSGKSYLTFACYHYLKNELNFDVNIIGIDLKKEIIENCNNIAKKLNFQKLNFVYGDVINFETDDCIDIVISLHACDTATDIAITKAISWDSKVILAVPCCQKEINKQLKTDFLPLLLKHGIVKEKFSTLLTDSIRNEVLECFGYKSNIVEFISENNTPKNQLIRAIKKNNKVDKNKFTKLENYLQNLNIKMFLINELKNKVEN